MPLRAALEPSSSNYSADAGLGSDTLSGLSHWRAALLGTAAAGALWLGAPRSAYAACQISGTTVTCTGDESNGISSFSPGGDFDGATTETLNILNLTSDISPGSGDLTGDGVYFNATGGQDIVINSDLGSYEIDAYNNGFNILAEGNVGLDHTGDITTEAGDGIYIGAGGNVTVELDGDIDAGDDGIALYNGDGVYIDDVNIDARGNITATGDGIVIGQQVEEGPNRSYVTGTADIVVTGDIDAGDEGIVVYAEKDVDINVTGNLTAGGHGVYAYSSGGGIDVYVDGNVVGAGGEGVLAHALGAVDIELHGDVTAGEADGVDVSSFEGGARVAIYGDINADDEGIEVNADGDIDIRQTGDIFAGGHGVFARSEDGGIDVYIDGNVLGEGGEGIVAQAWRDVDVEVHGNVTAGVNDGIDAGSSGGSTRVAVYGDVDANSDGIEASAYGHVDVTHVGRTDALGNGIEAFSISGGIEIVNDGVISAGDDGIHAYSFGDDFDDGNIDIRQTGDIFAGPDSTDDGIFAEATRGTVKINSKGNISAGGVGIDASGLDGVDIDHEGDINSANERGVRTYSESGAIDILVKGDILANDDGINAQTRGAGQKIDIVITGDVLSEENFGIYAASGLFSAGGGDVTITIEGDVTTLDDAHDAVHARSFDSGDLVDEPGNITVNIKGGTIRGTEDSVEIQDGLDNTLTNRGTIVSDFATDRTAVRGGTGNETIDNFLDILGNVDLGSGTNRFNNWEESFFASGEIVNLGSDDNILWNRGTLSPGDKDNIVTTELTGSFDQSDFFDGTIETDVDLANGNSDVLAVSGDAAVGGWVQARVMNVDSFSGPQSFRVLTAGGTLDNPGDIAALGTPVVSAHVDATEGAGGFVDLVIDGIDFTAPESSGLSDNELNIAGYLNDLLGDPAFDPATDPDEEGIESYMDFLANLLTEEDLAKGLDRLSPAIYGLTSQTVAISALNFTEGLLSCPTNDGAASGAEVFIREGQCFWIRATGRSLDVDGQDGASTYDEQAAAISGGVQIEINPDLYAGFGLGYEYSQLDTDSGADAEGDIGHVGASLKYLAGIFQLGGTVYGGIAQYDTSRDMGPAGTTDGSADIGFLGGRIRAAAVFGSNAVYIKPMVDLDLIGIKRDGSEEDGGTGLELLVDGETDYVASIAPAIEIGGQTILANGVVRPFIRGGARFFTDDDFSATASFAETDAGGSMTVSNGLDTVVGEVSAGIDMLNAAGTSVRVSYDGRFSDDIQQHGASVKLRQGF